MNEIGLDAQRRGRIAEERVASIAEAVGLPVLRNALLDYANKIDMLIDGMPVQISVKPKSRGEQRRLAARGIDSIVAGTGYNDEQVFGQIMGLIQE